MLDLLLLAAVIVIAIALLPRVLEQLGENLPWLPLAVVIATCLFLIGVTLKAVAKARAKALRRRVKAAQERWQAGMVRLSRKELLRLQAAWATIERPKVMNPNDPEYAEVQETQQQAVEFIRDLRTQAASQGRQVPESSAECHKVLRFLERQERRALEAAQEGRARELRDAVGWPAAEPVRRSRAHSIARVAGDLCQRLRAEVIRPRAVVVGVSVLLGVVLIAEVARGAWWEVASLVLAGGLIGAALARWWRGRMLDP